MCETNKNIQNIYLKKPQTASENAKIAFKDI